MWRKARRRENVTDWVPLLPLVLYKYLSLLLLHGIGLLIPFHRRGRWRSERLSESLRANQLLRGAGMWVLGCLLPKPLWLSGVRRRMSLGDGMKAPTGNVSKRQSTNGKLGLASRLPLSSSASVGVSRSPASVPRLLPPRAPSRPLFPLYLSLHLPPLISNFQACELLQKA